MFFFFAAMYRTVYRIETKLVIHDGCSRSLPGSSIERSGPTDSWGYDVRWHAGWWTRCQVQPLFNASCNYKVPFIRYTNSVRERGRDHETRRGTTRRVALISACSIDPDQWSDCEPATRKIWYIISVSMRNYFADHDKWIRMVGTGKLPMF